MRVKIYSAALWLIGCVACVLACAPGVEDENGGVVAQAPTLGELAISTRSVTVCVEDENLESAYTFCLYRDAACQQLMQQYKVSAATTASFTFPYLEPQTTYYAVAVSPAGVASEPLELMTAIDDSDLARKLYVNDFDKLCWGGDYVNGANAVVLNNCTPATLTNMAHIEDAIAHSKATTKPSEEGPKVVDCPIAIRQLLSINDLDCTEHVYMAPGYIRLGSTKETGYSYIMTKQFFGLPDDCGVNVSLRLAPYKSGGKDVSGKVILQRMDESNKSVSQKVINFKAAADELVWQDCSVTFDEFKSGERLLIAVKDGFQVCLDDLKLYTTADLQGDVVCGTVCYSDGTPIEGVAVSDGFTVVATNAEGYYEFHPSTDAWHIFISVPSDCKIPMSASGHPDFYKRYSLDTKRYDFTLERLEGGVEKRFALFCLGDPQVSTTEKYNRFHKETCPSLLEHSSELEAKGLNCYAITLGDIVSSSNNSDASGYMPKMRSSMAEPNVGLPIFQVMGNHDFKGKTAVVIDATSSTYELKAQRTFESNLGPVNYSFNRGDVHIVGMRDIIYNFDTKGTSQYADYSKGFTDMQYEWLKQDLALVPKNKMVILCVHAPLYAYTDSYKNVGKVFKLMSEFAEAHVMSGHTHDMRNKRVNNYNRIFDHVMGATCGCWWASTLCKDGGPNGYGVFFANGNTFENWYYKGVNRGMNTKDYQMRLYAGDVVAGGSYEYITSAYGAGALLANIFNADDRWRVELYVAGNLKGYMSLIKAKNGYPYAGMSFADIKSAGYSSTKDKPFVLTDTASNDWYANGYHVGVKGQSRTDRYCPSYNMYKFSGLTADEMSKVEVVATDHFGNVYRSSTVVRGKVGDNFTYELIAPPAN